MLLFKFPNYDKTGKKKIRHIANWKFNFNESTVLEKALIICFFFFFCYGFLLNISHLLVILFYIWALHLWELIISAINFNTLISL